MDKCAVRCVFLTWNVVGRLVPSRTNWRTSFCKVSQARVGVTLQTSVPHGYVVTPRVSCVCVCVCGGE